MRPGEDSKASPEEGLEVYDDPPWSQDPILAHALWSWLCPAQVQGPQKGSPGQMSPVSRAARPTF